MNTNKLQVEDKVDVNNIFDVVEMPLNELASHVSDLVERWGGDATYSAERWYDSIDFTVKFMRPEYSHEYDARMEREKKRAKKVEEKERKEYERLKEKFES